MNSEDTIGGPWIVADLNKSLNGASKLFSITPAPKTQVSSPTSPVTSEAPTSAPSTSGTEAGSSSSQGN